jgi:hypothetical protein
MMALSLALVLARVANAVNTEDLASHTADLAWDCKIVNCSCQEYADYYGTIAGYGFGCAPSASYGWWSTTAHCAAKAKSGKYCDGPACHLAGHAPCQNPHPPAPPSPAPPPARPARQCSSWSADPLGCVGYYNVEWDGLLPEQGPTWVNTMPVRVPFDVYML